jgi:hypothetical protein
MQTTSYELIFKSYTLLCAWTRPYYENITEYNNTTAEEKEQPPIYGRLRHERLNEALKTPYIASNKGHGREENV